MGSGERPIRVAIVEDHDDLLRLFVDLFVDAGFDVALAVTPDGFPARWDGDVIVADSGVHTYERDAVERRIRCLRERSAAKIILVSAHSEAARDAVALRVDGFVATPFEIDEMVAAVRRAASLTGR